MRYKTKVNDEEMKHSLAQSLALLSVCMKGWPKFADILKHITKCDIRTTISHILHKFIDFNYYQRDGEVFNYRLVQLENFIVEGFRRYRDLKIRCPIVRARCI